MTVTRYTIAFKYALSFPGVKNEEARGAGDAHVHHVHPHQHHRQQRGPVIAALTLHLDQYQPLLVQITYLFGVCIELTKGKGGLNRRQIQGYRRFVSVKKSKFV